MAQAVERLRELEPLGVELVEQPVATLERAGERAAADRACRVAADESVATPEDARAAVTAGACDCATVKIAKVGGLRAAMAIAAELPVYLSSALDGPVGIAAAAHLAQVLPGRRVLRTASRPRTCSTSGDRVARVRAVADAQLLPSDGPGLGVEIDEPALAALPSLDGRTTGRHLRLAADPDRSLGLEPCCRAGRSRSP